MIKILNILKKSWLSILLILGLLYLQVQCDLKLPEYTANIINVGISQNGIKDGVPESIREDKLDLALYFTDNEEKEYVLSHYKLIDESSNEYNKYLKEYSILENEKLYILRNISESERENINNILKTPLIITNFLTNDTDETIKMRENMLPEEIKNLDFEAMIPLMPKEQIEAIKDNFNTYINELEPSMLAQMNTLIIKAEYEAVGFDLKALQTNYIIISGAKMIGVALAAMILMIIITYLSARVGAGFSRDLRSDVTHKVMEFSNREFEEFSTASLITRNTNDIQQIQMLVIILLRMILYAPLLGLGALSKVSSSQMSWIIGVAVLTILSLVVILLIIAMPKFKSLQKLIDKINLISREILTGLPVIRAFATEDKEEKRFDEANVNLTKTNLFVNRIMTIMMPTMMFIMNGVSILIIWVGSKYVDLGTMQVGTLMAFITYTMQIIMAFLMLTMISIMLPRALVSVKRVAEIFGKKITINNPENPVRFKEKGGAIEFKDVYFRYPDASEDVLENINFKVKPGTVTAFIGSTGSGKSTLINLIPRFFDITGGKIIIDGEDIRNVTLEDLRSKIGFVPQKGILFTGDIASNIAFGKDNLTDEEIEKSAQIAQASDFIKSMTDGYKSSISQGGTNVSGGQKQRLAIARAIAKDPEILIFDDSFSALDYKTDKNLRKALKKNLRGKTVLIVASRIATILDADQIIVLDKGSIVGIGTHKELIASNEIYKEIAYSQVSKEEIDNA